MTADIKRAWGTWFVVPHDGVRGGIVVPSVKAAVALCEERGWQIGERPHARECVCAHCEEGRR